MNLHVVGGSFKGRPLKTPKGSITRPTTALLRKAVFDILRPIIEESSFLDLFAGSGAMGIEALSQGAAKATFVEESRAAVQCLKANLEALEIERRCKIIAKPVFQALKSFKEGFDIIYADPPYEIADSHYELLALVDGSALLNSGGALFLEEGYPSKLKLAEAALKNLVHKDSRHFGKSFLHQFRKVRYTKFG